MDTAAENAERERREVVPFEGEREKSGRCKRKLREPDRTMDSVVLPMKINDKEHTKQQGKIVKCPFSHAIIAGIFRLNIY